MISTGLKFGIEVLQPIIDASGHDDQSDNRSLTGANTVRAVDQDERKDRNVPLRFNTETIIDQVGKKRVITEMHQLPSDFLRECRNITRRRMVLPPRRTSTKLTCGDKEAQVIRADKVLSQINDG
jgi:hypothetical protein